MALVRWEPFEGLTSLRRDMDRLFEDFMGRVPSRMAEGTGEPAERYLTRRRRSS